MFLLFLLTINGCRFMETIKNNSPSGTGRTMIGIGKPKRATSLYSYVMPSRESFVPINSAQKVNRMKWPGIDYCGLYLMGEESRWPNRPLRLCYDLLVVALSCRLCSSWSPGRGSQHKEEEKTINYPTHSEFDVHLRPAEKNLVATECQEPKPTNGQCYILLWNHCILPVQSTGIRID